ncbi:MAG TPA: RHS repeat-associated core domain-containing protein, partial [Pyrinomonadaceae bacterium]|nr:RHS repeat-associated core domain-containing protein [Pyrinomonadaceae bacterium]
NDGTRYMGANGDHYWRDEHGVPTWIEVAFSGPKTIDEIDVFTCRDDYATQTDPSATQTFSNYGTTSFQVQYWNPDTSGWTVVSGGSFTGNNLVWRKITFSAVTTTKIKVTVSAAADNVARLMEVEAWSGSNPGTPAKNMALVSNGGVATAQNYTQDGYYPGQDFHFQPSYANDGTRYMGANGDRYWRDEHGVPTWIEVAFSGPKTIDEIDVFTCRDDYATQSDPSATQTFSNYGTTSFQVQYWNGSSWVAVTGGSITGNNLVWRKITFSAVITTKIKVTISATPDNVARLMEVEAWGYETANVRWLVPDQLGTPRMIVDQTGSLSGISRHDYLPFGEELFGGPPNQPGAGGRLTTQGYSASDNVRQKFTQKERDNETGLDYFLARYYSSTQGRFTSVDPLMASGSTGSPQSWNRYSYSYNNPLRFTDPSGMLPGDFYNEEGKRLGTDGLNDGKVYVVTDQAQANQIQQTDKNKKTTQVGAVSSAVELPSAYVRGEMEAAVARSNSPTQDDKQGGFHEEGGTFGTLASGQEKVVNAVSGAYADPRVQGGSATIATSNPANPSEAGILTSVSGTFHVHPKGKIDTTPASRAPLGTTVISGTVTTATAGFIQPPSSIDIQNAQRLGISNNIVVGAGSKKVYIYSGAGVRATFPLKQFLNIGRK